MPWWVFEGRYNPTLNTWYSPSHTCAVSGYEGTMHFIFEIGKPCSDNWATCCRVWSKLRHNELPFLTALVSDKVDGGMQRHPGLVQHGVCGMTHSNTLSLIIVIFFLWSSVTIVMPSVPVHVLFPRILYTCFRFENPSNVICNTKTTAMMRPTTARREPGNMWFVHPPFHLNPSS